jgi:HAD superfamily hydrolase (TIGR01509 family)
MIKYAIFDLDGTLLDYEGPSHTAFKNVLAKYDRTFTLDLHGSIIGTHHTSWSRKIIDYHQLNNVVSPDEFAHEYHEEVEKLFASMPLMPGAEELLRRLKNKKIPIAIATSSSAPIVPKKIVHHPCIKHCVDLIVTGDDPVIKEGKPAPDIFLLAARRLGCPESDLGNCYVFEDSPFGVLGGIRAGMQTVAIPDRRFLTKEAMETHSDIFNRATLVLGSLENFETV